MNDFSNFDSSCMPLLAVSISLICIAALVAIYNKKERKREYESGYYQAWIEVSQIIQKNPANNAAVIRLKEKIEQEIRRNSRLERFNQKRR